MRKTILVAFTPLLVSAAALAQGTPTAAPAAQAASAEHGVFLQDIDKPADACTDFYQYANGAWRAANPTPASMPRWSRRWSAGEQNKEQLRTLLDDLSK